MNINNNQYLDMHKGKIIGSIIGLALALLFVIFGFWNTIFIIAFILVGAFLGSREELLNELQGLFNRLWYGRER